MLACILICISLSVSKGTYVNKYIWKSYYKITASPQQSQNKSQSFYETATNKNLIVPKAPTWNESWHSNSRMIVYVVLYLLKFNSFFFCSTRFRLISRTRTYLISTTTYWRVCTVCYLVSEKSSDKPLNSTLKGSSQKLAKTDVVRLCIIYLL